MVRRHKFNKDSLCNLETECQVLDVRGPGIEPLYRGGLRLIDSCITQLKAQGPSRTCNESKEEEVRLWTSRPSAKSSTSEPLYPAASASSLSNRPCYYFFSSLGLYWRSPESGDLWYKSRQLIKTICSQPLGTSLQLVQPPLRNAFRVRGEPI